MHSSRVLLEGHVGRTLTLIADGLAPRAAWPDGLPAKVRRALAAAFAAPSEWGPHAVFEALRAAAPAGTIATVDSGAHRILMSEMWPCEAPRTLLQSTGLCTMGCALPLATGAALGAPSRPVLCVVGDAGLEMVAGELATLRDLKLSVVVAVLVDESLALIELKQRGLQLANAGVDFGATDFPALARAFGGFGVAVESRAELQHAARDAFAREGFTLIACRIGRRAYDGAF